MSENSAHQPPDLLYIQLIGWILFPPRYIVRALLGLLSGLWSPGPAARQYLEWILAVLLLALIFFMGVWMVMQRYDLLDTLKDNMGISFLVSGIATLALPTYISRYRRRVLSVGQPVMTEATQADSGVDPSPLSQSPAAPPALNREMPVDTSAATNPTSTVSQPHTPRIPPAAPSAGGVSPMQWLKGRWAWLRSKASQEAVYDATTAMMTWLSFAVFLFFTSELVLINGLHDCGTLRFHPDDCGYPLSQFLLFAGIAALIGVYIQWYTPLYDLLVEYANLIELNITPQAWAQQQMRRIFGMNPMAMIVIGVVVGALFAIMLVLDFPFQNQDTKNIGYGVLFLIAPIGGHGIYMAAALYHLLYSLDKYTIKSPGETTAEALTSIAFYNWPHPIVNKLRSYYYMNFSIVAVVVYLWLLVLIGTSPFGLNIQFLVFLSVLALFPFPAFLWTSWQTNAISERIQAKSVEIVNRKVAELYWHTPGKEDVEIFEKWLAIQDRLISKPTFEPRMSLFLTGIFAILTVILQTIVNIQEIVPG